VGGGAGAGADAVVGPAAGGGVRQVAVAVAEVGVAVPGAGVVTCPVADRSEDRRGHGEQGPEQEAGQEDALHLAPHPLPAHAFVRLIQAYGHREWPSIDKK
jgi:hypothetical protein